MKSRPPPAWPFEPQLLSAFRAVIDAGSVSAAARAIHLSQPAVTAQIRRLERQLKATLFLRRPRGMSPTAAARRLAAAEENARRGLCAAASELSAASEPEGLLEVYASTTIAECVLPDLIAGFAAQHPRVRVRLVSENTDEILERVRSGRAEIGLVEGLRRAAGVSLSPFAQDELIAVAAPSAMPRRSGLSALRERPVLWRERGSGTRAVVERALLRAGAILDRRPRFELSSTEAIKQAAISGLGVAFLSRWSMRRELALGLLCPVPGKALSIRRSFLWALPGAGLSGLSGLFFSYANSRRAAPAGIPDAPSPAVTAIL